MTFYSPDGLQGINIGFSLGQIPLSSTFNNNGNMTVNMMSSSNGVNMYMSLVTDAASQISIESGNLNVRQYSSAEYTTKPVASLYGGVYVASDASLGFFIATANYYGGSLTGMIFLPSSLPPAIRFNYLFCFLILSNFIIS